MNFDWQTGKEDSQSDDTPSGKLPASRAGKGRVLTILPALLAVAVAALVIYEQVSRRVEQATTTAEQDVLASYQVVRQAAARADLELFTSTLSGRDPRWTAIQKELLEQGALFDRSPLALPALPVAPQIVSVVLSPDFTRAEVQADFAYVVNSGNGLTETLALRQTAVFRRGERHWLYAPPENEFWGVRISQEGRYLTAVYPARDQELAGRIALDLDEALDLTCTALVGLNCPADLHLNLRFETNPASLLALADEQRMLVSGRDITLPTPTLVGRPVDETGYQALYQGYAAQVVSAIITDLVGWQCCEQFVFHKALLDRQLSVLSLRPWPLTAADYEQMLDWPLNLSDLNDLWYRSSMPAKEEVWPVYTLVDLVLSQAPGTSPAALQRRLQEAGSYWVWLLDFVAREPSLEWEWRRLIYERSLSARQPSPIPLPDQDILFLCQSPPDYTLTSLHRYLVDRSGRRQELSARPIDIIYPLADDAGLVLVERAGRFGSPPMRIVRWQHGQTRVVYEGRIQTLAGPYGGHSDPAGRYLVLFDYDSGAAGNQHTLLALNRCDPAGCELRGIPGAPIWSADGSQMLAMAFDGDFTLLRGDGDGRSFHKIGAGRSPFWLDNETYGYLPVQLPATPEEWSGPQAVVTAVAASDEAQVLVTLADLAGAIPEAERPDQLFMDGVTATPAGPNRLFVVARGYPQAFGPGRSYLFSLDRQSGTISLVWQADGQIAEPLHFSPGGRWLVFSTRGESGGGLYLYDTVENQTKRYAAGTLNFDWSAGGQWLLRVYDGYFILLAPAHDYRRLIFHDSVGCRHAFWVNRP